MLNNPSMAPRDRERFESNLEQAFLLLSQACSRDARNSKAFAMRGKCYYQMGDFQRAIYDFAAAIAIEEASEKVQKKDLAELYNFCGIQHFELG